MKKILLSLGIILLFYCNSIAQLLTWSPQFPADNSNITITMDATKGNKALMGFTGSVYMHLGLITSNSADPSAWKYVFTAWGTTTAPAATSLGSNKWSFTLPNPRTYFNAPAGVPPGETILKVALLFRDAAGTKVQKNADNSDMYISIYPASGNYITFTQPPLIPNYLNTNEAITATVGQSLPLTAVASNAGGTLKMYYNGNLITGPLTGTATITGNPTIANTSDHEFVAELNTGGQSYYDTLQYYIAPQSSTIAPLPSGVKEGINYYGCTDSVTLVLYAPNKSTCILLGDFPGSNWALKSQFQMKKTPDGIYYWITVKGLTPGTEYAYQYLVDNNIYIADPNCEKILDPWNDKYINDAPHPNTYPNLKTFPAKASISNGFISVLQICEPQYTWQTTNFTKPDKRNLIIYELLVRDFSKESNYQTVIDSIGYFRRLGINAIHFMPLQEFEGNNSWGYNPIFYYAPDKAYGPKNKLKELIDTLHKNGIAAILDVVYNHMVGGANPQGKLYWDGFNKRPAGNSPWFNPVSPQTFLSFFEDLNHNSAATQYLVQNSLEHWIKEYKIDGFRFDYTKGITQTVSSIDNSAYDQSRIDHLNRYYDYIVPKYPNTYMILEHFCVPSEENVLINKGFMPWREMYAEYNQSVEGNGGNKNLGDIMWNYGANGRNAPSPGLLGFMNSHDKERTVYNCIMYGNSSGGYNIKDTATAVERMEAAAAVLFTVPGPKMFYQFDEMGYDIPRAGNTDPKAPKWEYLLKPYRQSLYNAYAKIIQLRLANPSVFNNTPSAYDLNANGGYVKYFQIGDPNINSMQVSIVANFGVTNQSISINFQKTGKWYNYLSNNTTGTGSTTAGLNGSTNTVFDLSFTNQTIVLAPGEYHIYVSQSPTYTFSGNGNWDNAANWSNNTKPPTMLPAGSEIIIDHQAGGECIINVQQTISAGAKFTVLTGKSLKIPLNLILQ